MKKILPKSVIIFIQKKQSVASRKNSNSNSMKFTFSQIYKYFQKEQQQVPLT